MSLYSVLVLLLVLKAIDGKYVYVLQQEHWLIAQEICQKNYTDLAPMSNEYDNSLLYQLYKANPQTDHMWIGLIRNSSNHSIWLWSGGGLVSKTFWCKGQPDNGADNHYGAVFKHDDLFEWSDLSYYNILAFFCYKVHAVSERKTWEEALQYCRENYKNLSSVASETEMILMQKELNKLNYVTEHVWIGLRFLAGDWMWVDGQPLEYEAWGEGSRPMCPPVDTRCGALEMIGSSVPLGVNDPAALAFGLNITVTIQDVKVWNPRNCDEKLAFLCY